MPWALSLDRAEPVFSLKAMVRLSPARRLVPLKPASLAAWSTCVPRLLNWSIRAERWAEMPLAVVNAAPPVSFPVSVVSAVNLPAVVRPAARVIASEPVPTTSSWPLLSTEAVARLHCCCSTDQS
ncbi:hypothetical protein [Methylobacterium sp. WL6]|uniref:hypothetical protein n=1 Tax=Methylobacterium sp. WL6 TaxID=2603901 RepID=UPI001FEF4CB1|nr:hypothetical protein [Methylobacterium sp. WL6]